MIGGITSAGEGLEMFFLGDVSNAVGWRTPLP